MFFPAERKIEIRGREQKKNKLLKSSEESSAFVINQRLTFLWVTHRTLTVFRWKEFYAERQRKERSEAVGSQGNACRCSLLASVLRKSDSGEKFITYFHRALCTELVSEKRYFLPLLTHSLSCLFTKRANESCKTTGCVNLPCHHHHAASMRTNKRLIDKYWRKEIGWKTSTTANKTGNERKTI